MCAKSIIIIRVWTKWNRSRHSFLAHTHTHGGDTLSIDCRFESCQQFTNAAIADAQLSTIQDEAIHHQQRNYFRIPISNGSDTDFTLNQQTAKAHKCDIYFCRACVR